ncbi:hypothetical protein SpCBS45565_g03685 [Spizellomyces sp. 'palustris']|nr:hypothetical protein SpCBS45565_g03685 [Spizellomyces sp. 'palustris']
MSSDEGGISVPETDWETDEDPLRETVMSGSEPDLQDMPNLTDQDEYDDGEDECSDGPPSLVDDSESDDASGDGASSLWTMPKSVLTKSEETDYMRALSAQRSLKKDQKKLSQEIEENRDEREKYLRQKEEERHQKLRQERAKRREARRKAAQEQHIDPIAESVTNAMVAFHQAKWTMSSLCFATAVKEWTERTIEPTVNYTYSLSLLRYLHAYVLIMLDDDKRGPEILDTLRSLKNSAAQELPFVYWSFGKALNRYDKYSDEAENVLEEGLTVCSKLPVHYQVLFPDVTKTVISESVPATLKALLEKELQIAKNRPEPNQACQHDQCVKRNIYWGKDGPLCARVTCNATQNCVLYYHKSCWRRIEKRLYGVSGNYLMGQDCPSPGCDGLIVRYDDVTGSGEIRKTFSKNILYAAGQQTAANGRSRTPGKKSRAISRSASRLARSRRQSSITQALADNINLNGNKNMELSNAAPDEEQQSSNGPVYFAGDARMDVAGETGGNEGHVNDPKLILKSDATVLKTSATPNAAKEGDYFATEPSSELSETDTTEEMEHDESGLFDTPELLEYNDEQRNRREEHRKKRLAKRAAKLEKKSRSAYDVKLEDAILIPPKKNQEDESSKILKGKRRNKDKQQQRNKAMTLSEFHLLEEGPKVKIPSKRKDKGKAKMEATVTACDIEVHVEMEQSRMLQMSKSSSSERDVVPTMVVPLDSGIDLDGQPSNHHLGLSEAGPSNYHLAHHFKDQGVKSDFKRDPPLRNGTSSDEPVPPSSTKNPVVGESFSKPQKPPVRSPEVGPYAYPLISQEEDHSRTTISGYTFDEYRTPSQTLLHGASSRTLSDQVTEAQVHQSLDTSPKKPPTLTTMDIQRKEKASFLPSSTSEQPKGLQMMAPAAESIVRNIEDLSEPYNQCWNERVAPPPGFEPRNMNPQVMFKQHDLVFKDVPTPAESPRFHRNPSFSALSWQEMHGDYLNDLPDLGDDPGFYSGMSQTSSLFTDPDGNIQSQHILSQPNSIMGMGAMATMNYSKPVQDNPRRPILNMHTGMVVNPNVNISTPHTNPNMHLGAPQTAPGPYPAVGLGWIPPVPRWAHVDAKNWTPPANPGYLQHSAWPPGSRLVTSNIQPYPFAVPQPNIMWYPGPDARPGSYLNKRHTLETRRPPPIFIPPQLPNRAVLDPTIREIQQEMQRLKNRPMRQLPLRVSTQARVSNAQYIYSGRASHGR